MKLKRIFLFLSFLILLLFLSSLAIFLAFEKSPDPKAIESKIQTGATGDELTKALTEAYPLDKSSSQRFWNRYFRWLRGKANVDQLSR